MVDFVYDSRHSPEHGPNLCVFVLVESKVKFIESSDYVLFFICYNLYKFYSESS